HSSGVRGARELADGRILSWSWDKRLRLWNGQSGECLEIVAQADAANLHPEWLHARFLKESPDAVAGDFHAISSKRSAHLRHKNTPSPLAAWNAESDSEAPLLFPDGTAVVTQQNGQVCILKLYHGNRRVTLEEVEKSLACV
ncbi:hypothetical protein, partial [Haloferula sp. A504]|uniref:hypothetical protein n=1 Tax=Haloferula sp. A504 TaxID=3373601 RepID=UPI0031C530C9|nr:hypothetical protein [Verrucomicrobiaceae bacterium E54]